MSTDLVRTLTAFAARANANPSLGKLVAGWDRSIVIEATDTGEAHALPVRGRRIGAVTAPGGGDTVVHLRGKAALLTDVFSGCISPVDAAIDGTLSVFGSDTDQIKLDAIALVLWGCG